MNKLFLLFALFLVTLNVTYAQSFKVGLHGGISGASGEIIDPALAVDVAYLFLSTKDFEAGVVSGYVHIFENDSDFQYFPVGVGLRYKLNNLKLGSDIGYAAVINDETENAFFYAPRVEYEISELLAIVASYRGLAIDSGRHDIVALGMEITLHP